MTIDLVVAMVGVLGGALVAYLLLAPRARIDERTTQAAATYADMLDALARGAGLSEPARRYSAARARIAVYGDSKTVKAVAAIGGDMSDTDDQERLITAVQSMRAHLGEDDVARSHIRQILFGSD